MGSEISKYFSKNKGAVLLPPKKRGGHQFQCCKKDLLYSFYVYASDALAIVLKFV